MEAIVPRRYRVCIESLTGVSSGKRKGAVIGTASLASSQADSGLVLLSALNVVEVCVELLDLLVDTVEFAV